MARAAFVMDRAMRVIGLHGKSFLPLLIGFGCTVPAVYATRTLENEHDRKLTGFLATFMSCGARLPVYAVFGAAFFGAQAGNRIFGLYLLGIGVALATGFVAGAFSVMAGWWLESRRIDDVVGAVSVPAVGGVWGTLAAGLFKADALFDLNQLGIQALGCAVAFVWAFGGSLAM